jgi:DMSO/TMAO reductase YedYZ molybdopterin-dependent catalytic subunit
VAFTGTDRCIEEGEVIPLGGSIPLAKALAPEVLLVDEMNGQPLPPAHGYPPRVIVPGYIGARSIKWLSTSTVQSQASTNYFQARTYRLYPSRGAVRDHARARLLAPRDAGQLGRRQPRDDDIDMGRGSLPAVTR